jgi:hypothetical protein
MRDEPKLYLFSTVIATARSRQMRSFIDLAAKLKMPLGELMLQCNGKEAPSKALVKGLARELGVGESYLEKLAEEVRKEFGKAANRKP